MSTTPIDSWAVDLADVTYIYPFVGYEGLMAVVAVVFWLAWHVWRVKHENAEYRDVLAKHGDDDTVRRAMGDSD